MIDTQSHLASHHFQSEYDIFVPTQGSCHRNIKPRKNLFQYPKNEYPQSGCFWQLPSGDSLAVCVRTDIVKYLSSPEEISRLNVQNIPVQTLIKHTMSPGISVMHLLSQESQLLHRQGGINFWTAHDVTQGKGWKVWLNAAGRTGRAHCF